MLAVAFGCVCVVSGFGVVGSWALSTQKLPIANEKISIINNNIFLAIVLSSHARPCAPDAGCTYRLLVSRGFGLTTKEGTLSLYHSKRQISTIFRGASQKVQL